MRRHRILTGLPALALVTACGSGPPPTSGFSTSDNGADGGAVGSDAATTDDGGDDGGPETGSIIGSNIVLSPGNATVFIDTATTPPTRAKQTFKATFGAQDVTSTLSLSLQDWAVGTFSGQTFTSASTIPAGALGVTTRVTGTSLGRSGLANLTVVALRMTGADRDFYFIEPYKAAPSPADNVLEFGTKLQQVDVAILLDTTGSMATSIANVQQNLTKPGGILSGLQAAIPNVGIAVVDQRDYPYGHYGALGDFPVQVWQVVTTSAAAAQTGVDNYSLGNGVDDPESQIAAMDYLLTGNALTWPGGSVPAHTPAAGTEGGVDFRPGSFRVVVQITDAPWHNYDGTAADPLSTPYSFAAPDFRQLAADFATLNARYVGVVDDHSIDTHPHVESQALSDATDSNVPAAAFPGGQCNPQAGKALNGNCRLNFDILDGVGLDTSVVQAIQALSVGATFDVTAAAANDPSNPDGVDATKFIKELRAMGEGSAAQGCPPATTTKSKPSLAYDDVFVGVTAGTHVCFEVIPAENTAVAPKTSAQFFKALINVVGLPGNTPLDQRSVLFLVPPTDPSGTQQ